MARKCPYCRDGQMVMKTLAHPALPISDSFIVVEKMHQCESCDGRMFSAKERKRWTAEVRQHLEKIKNSDYKMGYDLGYAGKSAIMAGIESTPNDPLEFTKGWTDGNEKLGKEQDRRLEKASFLTEK